MAANRKARYERRRQAVGRRQQESRKARRGNLRRTLLAIAGGVALVVSVIGAFILFAGTQKILPPTGFGPNHLEAFPQQQINTQPIDLRIQEHVMERGGGHHLKGGMLVEYNCIDYQCDSDLVQRLTQIVESYPPQVYLAPFPGMDAKIALAAPDRLETLDAFDEQRIRQFIEKNLDR